MSKISDILFGAATRPLKTDTAYPLRQRIGPRQSFIILSFYDEGYFAAAVARATRKGFEVEVPFEVMSCDAKRTATQLQSFAVKHNCNDVLIVTTDAEVQTQGGKGTNDSGRWRDEGGKVQRTAQIHNPIFAQFLKFTFYANTVKMFEEAVEAAGLQLIGVQNFFVSVLNLVIKEEANRLEEHDLIMMNKRGGFLLATAAKGEWVTASSLSTAEFNARSWLDAWASDEAFTGRETPRPVCLISPDNSYQAVVEDVLCTKVDVAFYEKDYEALLLDAVAAGAVDFNLQTRPKPGRQVIGRPAVLFTWACLLLALGCVPTTAYFLWDKMNRDEHIAALKTEVEQENSKISANNGSIRKIRETTKLAGQQAAWVGDVTRLRYIVAMIDENMENTKMAKCEVRWADGRPQLSVEIEAIGDQGLLNAQLLKLEGVFVQKGFRNSNSERVPTPTGVRYRGTFLR